MARDYQAELVASMKEAQQYAASRPDYKLPEYQNENYNIPGAKRPDKSENLYQSYLNQYNQAKSYAENLKSTSDKLYGSYVSDARGALPGMIRKNREDYNSRGLLHSGLEQKAEAGTVGGVNRDLAGKRSAINQELNANLNQMEGGAFNTAGLLAQPSGVTAFDELNGIRQQLGVTTSENQNNAQLYGALLGGGASIGGAGLAQNMQQNGNNPARGGTVQDYDSAGSGYYNTNQYSNPYSPYAPVRERRNA